MNAYPIMLTGGVRALVVGGGEVAVRKTRALLDAGARVHVLTIKVASELVHLSLEQSHRVELTMKPYSSEYFRDVTLVVAATNSRGVNALVASEAHEAGKLVNVADAPELSDFVTPAVHRSGEITVAVVAGGVPTAAARIRDRIAGIIDERYAQAVADLAELRTTLLGSGNREKWHNAVAELLRSEFCDDVESGRFAERLDAWR